MEETSTGSRDNRYTSSKLNSTNLNTHTHTHTFRRRAFQSPDLPPIFVKIRRSYVLEVGVRAVVPCLCLQKVIQ
jgi:hypothetical protein